MTTKKPEPGRGMPPKKEKFWKEQSVKEDMQRLQWFTRNQQRLIEMAEKEAARKALSPEVLEEVEKLRVERYRNMVKDRHFKKKGEDLDLPDIDPHCIMNIMKPVPEEVKQILYHDMEKMGRFKYLKARYTISPDERYYFPECSNFIYGWKIRALQKQMADEVRRGRKQVIKNSFYRRSGCLRNDPENYREPTSNTHSRCTT